MSRVALGVASLIAVVALAALGVALVAAGLFP